MTQKEFESTQMVTVDASNLATVEQVALWLTMHGVSAKGAVAHYQIANAAQGRACLESLLVWMDGFAGDVCESVLKYKSISTKQAYVIARYLANEVGVVINHNDDLVLAS